MDLLAEALHAYYPPLQEPGPACDIDRDLVELHEVLEWQKGVEDADNPPQPK